MGLALVSAISLLAGIAEARPIKVLTSILPLYCFAANILGDTGQVNAVISGNANPHDYQMSIRDRRRIEEADLIVLNGFGLDDWIEPVLHRAGKDKAILIASHGISNQVIRVASAVNPHAWLDPELARLYVTNILRGISRLDPENEIIYLRNAADFVKRLHLLDGEISSGLKAYAGSSIVTFHDSFRYFARRYQLTIAGVIEEVPDVSPSARYLGQLYQTIRTQKPKCIFAEPGFPSRLAEQMAHDLGIPIAVLDPLETGPLDPNRYENGMRANLRTLQEKLR